MQYLADPGEARDCSTNTSVTDYFINWVSFSSHDFTALLRLNGGDSSSRYKIVSTVLVKNFLNTKGHQNCIISSKGTAICGVASGKVCDQRGCPIYLTDLVYKQACNYLTLSSESSRHCLSQTVSAGELKLWGNVHPPRFVSCLMSHAMCHMSYVRCHMSHFFLLQFFFFLTN